MTKEEFKKQITKIQTAYSKTFSQEEMRLWYKNFEFLTEKEFEKAVDKTIQESTFMPKIADVRKRIESNPATDPYSYLYANLKWCKLIKE